MMLDVTVDVVALTDQTLRDFLDYCELAYNPQTSHIHAVYPQDIKTSELKAKFEEHGIKILGTKKITLHLLPSKFKNFTFGKDDFRMDLAAELKRPTDVNYSMMIQGITGIPFINDDIVAFCQDPSSFLPAQFAEYSQMREQERNSWRN